MLNMRESIKRENERESDTRLLTEEVGTENIAAIVARWTGIPVTKLGMSERQRLLKLADHLHEKLVGQERAVDAVAEAVLRSRAGLSKKNQPTGSFLFLGPTGVGQWQQHLASAQRLQPALHAIWVQPIECISHGPLSCFSLSTVRVFRQDGAVKGPRFGVVRR